MKNEYGQPLDANGYSRSILQDDLTVCYRCGRSCEKLDRHEVFPSANRQKSKSYGLWVMLCHETCHLYGVHKDPKEAERLKMKAQRVAMKHYGWTKEEFIQRFGKSYI